MNYELFEHNNKSIYLVDMRREENNFFSELFLKWFKKYLKQWKKIWIIVNKKWYSSGVMCQDCWYIPKCEKCDVPIAYHLDVHGKYFGICHICKAQYSDFVNCPKCDSPNLKMYGLWTQKVSELLKEQFWINSLIIESEKVNSEKEVKDISQIIKNYQVVIGTSLLSVPSKDIIFDMLVFLNADIWLNIPDYQSNYRNFILLYETFTKHINSQIFIVQSFNPENYSIRNACSLNIEEFKKQELKYRKDFDYPPYTDLCILLYKHEIEASLFTKVNKLYQELLFLQEKYKKDIEIYSTPPLIYKMYGKYRYNIILKWKDLREFMDIVYTRLDINKRWFKIDRKAESIV